MAVEYRKVRGRGRVRRSKPSARLEKSKRWRRVEPKSDEAGQASEQQSAGETQQAEQPDGQQEGQPELQGPDPQAGKQRKSESKRGA